MANNHTIRHAQKEDVPRIQTLLQVTWHSSYDKTLGHKKVSELINEWHTKERLEEDILKENCQFLVCAEEGEIIATSFLNKQEKDAILGRMYIHPGKQNKGIGSELMEKILSSISKETCISLTVEPQNISAIKFYKRFGFTIQGPGSCSEDPHDEIPTLIMRRPPEETAKNKT